MRSHLPPRLGLLLLNRLADRNEALAGDLLEGFHDHQSRFWFWRELLGAIVTGAFRRTNEIRPLKLVEFPSWQPSLEDFAAKRLRLQTLGLSASPVQGIGGISIMVCIVSISLAQPMLWALLAFGLLSGAAIGWTRVVLTQRRRVPPGQNPTALVLFDDHRW